MFIDLACFVVDCDNNNVIEKSSQGFHLFVFGEDEGLNPVANVVENEFIQVMEQGYLYATQ